MPDFSKYTDQELMALLRDGNRRAYSEIYDRYNGPLYIFAYKRLQEREEVRDLIHELFLKLWADHASLPHADNLAAYLYTSVRNKIINVVARQKIADRYLDSFRVYAGENTQYSADYLVRGKEMQAFIESEIENLHPRMRLVFELSRKTELSRKEIAEQLGISEETVKSHMHGALKILKRRLGPLFFLLF